MYTTTIRSEFSSHTLFVQQIASDELPARIKANAASTEFTTWYVVRNWDNNGVVFMYLCKGHESAPKQICAFYRGGALWSSYGKTIKAAIEGAQRDGWLYA